MTTEWPIGSGATAARIREHDWSSTPLGPLSTWPHALRRAADITLGAPMASVLLWGPDHIVAAYNEGYRVVLGERPEVFGKPVLDVWAEARELLEPQLARVLGGETLVFREPPMSLSRGAASGACWFDYGYGPVRDDDGSVAGLIVSILEVTDRVDAQRALRDSEERQAFLLGLGDTLRLVSDPVDIMAAASEALGRHLGVGRCGYGEVDETGTVFIVERDWTDGVMPSFRGKHVFAGFGPAFVEACRAGRNVVIHDALAGARAAGSGAASPTAGGVRASLVLPIIKKGRFVAGFFVQQLQPRRWTARDEALAVDVAERTWSAVVRARAEGAWRASEERFTQFAKASSGGIWIRDAATLAMEYVSPAIGSIYGIEPEAILGDIERWAAMIVPEDRAGALTQIESACRGASPVHEFRIQRQSDGAFRWIRNSDFPLDQNGHVGRIGGIAEDVTQARLSVEHQAVLLAELQHRVRNIMAITRSIVSRTAENADSVAAYAGMLSGRLLTLARVQSLLTRAATATVKVATIVQEEFSAQATHAGQFELQGPDVALSPKAAETMTLAIHELTTNALKYGALSTTDGLVRVHWRIVEKRGGPWLDFTWSESGAPPRPDRPGPRRHGFGSELIKDRIPYELNGRGSVVIARGGARCHVEFPLKHGGSILETSAPKPTTVPGGVIDVSGEADLRGHTILVVEDDYYLATDTVRVLKGAGADGLGPCPTEAAARELLAGVVPSGAVLDINLAGGRSFNIAREMMDAGTPFIFITGYDQDVIPDAFKHVTRLLKPVRFREVVAALAEALGCPEQSRSGR